MRRTILALAALVAVLALPATAAASPARPAVAASFCGAVLSGASLAPYSETWIHGSSCPTKTFNYNQTYCVYPNGLHNTKYGPTKTGNGSISSNYSGVDCNTYGVGNPYHVWIWWDINGSGWSRTQLR